MIINGEFVIGMGYRVRAGIATHAHHDHLLWHPLFGEAPRWASRRTVELADDHRVELLDALGQQWPPRLAPVFARLTPVADDGWVPFGRELHLIVHDGHAPGHAAVWVSDADVLLAGDMLSDVELPMPLDPDDLPAYLAGLDVLAPFVARARLLVPGHGRPTATPIERLDATVATSTRCWTAAIRTIPDAPTREWPTCMSGCWRWLVATVADQRISVVAA